MTSSQRILDVLRMSQQGGHKSADELCLSPAEVDLKNLFENF